MGFKTTNPSVILVFDLAKICTKQQGSKAAKIVYIAEVFDSNYRLRPKLAHAGIIDRVSDGIFNRVNCDMKKISVASIPPIFDPVSRKEESTVACHGQTAKLHSRNGGLQDEKQVSESSKTI